MCGFPACSCAPFRNQQSSACGSVQRPLALRCVWLGGSLGIWLAAHKPSTDTAALCNSLRLVGEDVCLAFACLS